MEELHEIISEKSSDVLLLMNSINNLLERNSTLINNVTSDFIGAEFLDEIRNICYYDDVDIYFGKTLRDLKIVIQDENGLRDHNICLQLVAPRRFVIENVNLPHSMIQNREYRSLNEIIETFRRYINHLARYFYELEHIDQNCTIMEPINASFRDDHRRILLDDRTWLHVEVTSEGLATNVHLVGQSIYWHNKLQSGLLIWDHDKNIVENIMTIFDLNTFPQSTSIPNYKAEDIPDDALVCGICLCTELLEAPGAPQPLCQNATCGVYYHQNCLYQWLVACAGSRPPAFGVANGACPTCLQPITCSENDNLHQR